MDTKKSIFLSQQWLGFNIWFIMTLYYKCDRYYYKMRQLFHNKMRQIFITKCGRFFITKPDSFIRK